MRDLKLAQCKSSACYYYAYYVLTFGLCRHEIATTRGIHCSDHWNIVWKYSELQ